MAMTVPSHRCRHWWRWWWIWWLRESELL